jgi:hypothetical protein
LTGCKQSVKAETFPNWPTYYKGVNFTSWQAGEFSLDNTSLSLDQLEATHVDTVMVVPTWYMKTVVSNEVYEDKLKSATAEDLHKVLGLAKERGFRIVLKPHVDVANGDWRGMIKPENPDDWFMSYGRYLVTMAKIAQEEHCSFFVIGTELKSISSLYRDWWLPLIDEIKLYYKGPITYAANWDEYKDVSFWAKCDLIGIDAYFPLSDQANPTLEEITTAWNSGNVRYLDELESWCTLWQKPIVFTEVGYVSWDNAAQHPWEYTGHRPYNGKLQANCYQALINATQTSKWLAGIFWWNWEPKPVSNADDQTSLPPQGKPAESVLTSW